MNALLARDPSTSLGCAMLVGDSPRDSFTKYPEEFGSELELICGEVRPGSSGDSIAPNATGGSGGIAVTEAVKEHLQGIREEDENDANKLDWGERISVWVSADAQDLDRDYTRFEDGYDSDLWGVTVGTEFKINKSWVAGVAFNYNQWDGDFDSGGTFDTDSYGPIVYTSFSSGGNFFAEGLLSYVKREASNDRLRSYTNELGTEYSGKVSADRDENQIELGLLLGYNYPIRQFTIGPRFALDYSHTDFESYNEKGGTGLELEYKADSRESLQSKLGVQAAMSISTAFGVLVPQLGANWIHEYSDNQRSLRVQFVQDLRETPTVFSFQTDKPDRDFFELSAGVSAVLPHNIQAFVNYRILADHNFYDSQAGTVGLRVTF